MTIPIKRREPGLGEFEETDKIGFEHGGTNASSLLEAQDNLGISSKAEQSDFSSLLNDVVDLTEEVATKADAAAVNQALSLKADLVDGVIPAAQLPSFVDDVLNGTYIDDETFNDENDDPYTPEDGKIYVDTTTNKTYRWSGSIYVEIGGGGVALGETASTAYRGDRGKDAYDHSLSQGNPHNTTTSEITEGSKLFFTADRVRQTTLDGFSASTATSITAADNVLQALGKAQGQLNKAWAPTWVNADTIGTLFSAIDAHNLQVAKIDGMLFFRGWFRNSTTAIQTSNPILDITDSSYHVQHDNVDTFQAISSTLLYWGTTNGTIRLSVNNSTGVQQIATTSVLNATASHRKIGSGLWCAGMLKNP
ncbi:hypothetical protein EXE30_06870 [Acinetobacter halotolerans]|uniref:Uncharacterized protein n=1 Tax=Acinetobacter halotolerans TaxID=1752076 RepID=A0A4Q6XJ84_9GAMM|nr:hypothetical protein [Acinetobacter halotolerans]RZF53692.1 hypothetical protein EXE30_06870 [Acinetobacter halotolerans]